MKVLVGGCSVSDYTHVDRVWGEILAEKLKADYIHQGAGCGSNYRMWRKVGQHIMNGDVGKDDIVIMQYTQLHRREYFSPFTKGGEELFGSKGRSVLNEPYPDGNIVPYGAIIRYKPNAHTDVLAGESREKKFSKLRDYFSDPFFEEETFQNQNYMFQSLCLYKNINCYFLDIGYLHELKTYMLPEFVDKYINLRGLFEKYPLHGTDKGHYSQEGHNVVADILLNTITGDV